MKIKKIIKLQETEKVVLETAREIIADFCTEFESNGYCEDCPLFKMCDKLKINLNTDFESMFDTVVNILTE